MRLLDADTKQLESFEGDKIPDYAVLSHTWGPSQEEILFNDLEFDRSWNTETGPPQDDPKAVGWKKLVGACRQTLASGLAYVWIDTCCIDKSSSAELSEAINSMFQWYANSVVCYAYLADLYAETNARSNQAMDDFRASRWFTRGWTLQELLAPADVRFFDARWVSVGGKHVLVDTISEITGIPSGYMCTPNNTLNRATWDPHELLSPASVAEKMSWASRRQTTRVEDQAYCLLGIFDIAMPMLYGEGERAFVRLQEAIMESSDDCTLLAFNYGVPWRRPSSALSWADMKGHILASTPAAFNYCRDLVPWGIPHHNRPSFSMSQRGLKLKVPLLVDRFHKELAYAILACRDIAMPLSSAALPGASYARLVAIPLLSATPLSDSDRDEYWRPDWSRPSLVSDDFVLGALAGKPKAAWKKIFIKRPSPAYQTPMMPLSLVASPPHTAFILQAYPPCRISYHPEEEDNPGPQPPALEPTDSRTSNLRRTYRHENSFSLDIHDPQLVCTSSTTRRLACIRIWDLHLLVQLLFPAVSIPREAFVLKLREGEWPHSPLINVYALPRQAHIEDLQELYTKDPSSMEGASYSGLPELVPLDQPPSIDSSTTSSVPGAHDSCYRARTAAGEVFHFTLSVGYESRGVRPGTVTWELMPIIKVVCHGDDGLDHVVGDDLDDD